MAVVYQHRRKDNNSVFYIGIGSEKSRAYSKKGRNFHWKNISKKYGFDVDVLFEGIEWEDACRIEIGMIEAYGRKDLGLGPLVNMTGGGDGSLNIVWTDEAKDKISKSLIGNKRSLGFIHSDKSRKNMGASRIGSTHSDETKRKISFSNGKKVIDLNTGNIYDCVRIAANEIGVKYKTLISWLNGQNPNKSTLKYL